MEIGAEEVARWLRVPAAPAENPGWIPLLGSSQLPLTHSRAVVLNL